MPAPTCRACRMFRPECIAPIGEFTVDLCWLCAHHVVDHHVALAAAADAQCECLPTEIYPRSFFGKTAAAFESARDEVLARRGTK